MSDRYALIIANSRFDDPKLERLKTPARDAESFAKVLADPAIGGFTVSRLIDAKESDVRRSIGRLFYQRKRDDLLLFYYSGHGIRDEHGDLYLATRDTEMEIASATALSADFVRDQMDKSGSQRKVVILDSCHSGAFAKGGLGDSVGTQAALAGNGYGRVILTASDALELAWEGDEWLGEDRASVFTNFLVEGLQTGKADLDGDGKISLDELYRYVYDQIMRSGRAKQTPHKWAEKIEGQILIAHSPVVRAVKLPAALTQAIESPLAGIRKGAVEELARFMNGSHPGLALASRQKLEKLANDDSRSVSNAAQQALGESTKKKEGVKQIKAPSTSRKRTELPKTKLRKSPQLGKAFVDWFKRVPLWAKGLASLAVLLALVVSLVLSGMKDIQLFSSPTSTPLDLPTNVSLGDTWIRPADNAEMVYVPAGTFEMGSSEDDSNAYDDEKPQHTVTLDTFWIDKHEVTNAQYAAFLNEEGNQEEGGTTWLELERDYCLIEEVDGQFQPKEGYANHPVVEVSWYGARAYAEWVGGRLPTEAEWEYAARGPEGNIYPWGDQEPTCQLAQFYGCDGDTITVGSLPDGASWAGALDMDGNVWEWVGDWYGEDYYSRSPDENPTGPDSGDFRVGRGGAFDDSARYVRCAYRGRYLPYSWVNGRGFRVVASP